MVGKGLYIFTDEGLKSERTDYDFALWLPLEASASCFSGDVHALNQQVSISGSMAAFILQAARKP